MDVHQYQVSFDTTHCLERFSSRRCLADESETTGCPEHRSSGHAGQYAVIDNEHPVFLAIRGSFRDAAQLSKKAMKRSISFYAYLAFLVCAVAILNLIALPYDRSHADQVTKVIYLLAAVALLNMANVRVDRGQLSLAGIAIGTTALTTNPLDATIIGLGISLGLASRGPRIILANGVIYAAIACIASIVAVPFHSSQGLTLASRLLVLLTYFAANLALVAVVLSIELKEPIRNVVRLNASAPFYVAFVYMALASLLVSYVLDGSALGYLLATIVFVLALALTDTIAGRRVRGVLESELSDADRHLFHSRAVEGVVHNLRNHMANAVGYLREIDSRRLDPVDRESLETATAAANDAVTVLRSLSQGATPKVTFAPGPVDLNELVTRALGMARPRARGKEVQLASRETPDWVKVRADPLLLREVITNLVNNAIDAVDHGGRVEATTGKRGNGSPFVSIADNGPGVSDEQRHRLFEPHFTTKEGGTGLGLFMSYGIVREHQGQLTYDGNRRGAVFTVTLPPFAG
jgi:signal transduction histidine kinase